VVDSPLQHTSHTVLVEVPEIMIRPVGARRVVAGGVPDELTTIIIGWTPLQVDVGRLRAGIHRIYHQVNSTMPPPASDKRSTAQPSQARTGGPGRNPAHRKVNDRHTQLVRVPRTTHRRSRVYDHSTRRVRGRGCCTGRMICGDGRRVSR
jgi:hypothetical protein